MDFNFTQDENNFRKEIKDWLSKNLSQRISNKVKKFQRLDKNDYEEFMKALSAKGWLAVNWPKEHGGTGWSNTQKHIFEEEIVKAGAPRIVPFGLNMLGPVLMEFGNEKQKKYYLPRILNCDDWWAQGCRSNRYYSSSIVCEWWPIGTLSHSTSGQSILVNLDGCGRCQ